MKAVTVLGALATLASSALAFVPQTPAPVAARKAATTPRMALNAELTKTYPRDFKNIPLGTNYGACVSPCVCGWVSEVGRVDKPGLVACLLPVGYQAPRPSLQGGRLVRCERMLLGKQSRHALS